ncbi:MAG: hypothetical protein H0X45_01890 [Planctomycetes bacterium]|nr:hypothetical protein [Planctomycetota bacterium]
MEDTNEFEIQDASPAPIYASDDEDEAAELAAADAEIDAEEEELDDVADETTDTPADDELEGEDGPRANDAGDAGEDQDDTIAEIAPQIELTGEVYARIHECLSTQLAGVEAQITRAESISEADPFFDRWRVVLIAQRDRLLRQIGEAKARAPERRSVQPEEPAEAASEVEYDDEAGTDAEPQPLSA